MTEQEIIKRIRCGETSTVQFKQRFTSAKQIAEEFVAFANSKGGSLIFGVEDKTGNILGLSYDEIQNISRELGNIANDQVRPTIFLQTDREYIKTAPIRLLIFDDRIEIVSPGALADGLTIEDIKLGNTFQRNQLIAGFCAKTMMYRGLGSGLLRAYKDGARLQFVNSASGKQFTTVIVRDTTQKSAQLEGNSAQLNNKSAQKNEKIAQIKNESVQKTTQWEGNTTQKTTQWDILTELQQKVLKYLKLHPRASRIDLANEIDIATIDGIKYSLTRLQDLGFLQRVGSKRYGHWEVKID